MSSGPVATMREMATASRAAAGQAKLTADNAATAARLLQPAYVAAQDLARQAKVNSNWAEVIAAAAEAAADAAEMTSGMCLDQ